MTSGGRADQAIKVLKMLEQGLPVATTLGKHMLSHMPNTRDTGQRLPPFDDGFHLRQEDPLHPLLKIQAIDTERLQAGKVVFGRDLV